MESQSSEQSSDCIDYVVYTESDDDKYKVDSFTFVGDVAKMSTLKELRKALHAELPSANKPEKSGELRLYKPGAIQDDGSLKNDFHLMDDKQLENLSTSQSKLSGDGPLIVIAPKLHPIQQQQVSNIGFLLSPSSSLSR